MISIDVLQKKIDKLESLASEVEDLAKQIISGSSIFNYVGPFDDEYSPPSYYWDDIPEKLKKIQSKALRDYQIWYSSAFQLIRAYVPEKEDEFKRCYEGVLNYIQLNNSIIISDSNRTIVNAFDNVFQLQRSILLSAPYVIEIKEYDLRKIITADLIDSELDKADYLYKTGFERCAGVIAGVALERYLKALCDKEKVEYKYDDTIEPLAQALYKAEKIDPTEFKKFQHLGGIRNDCAHPKDIPEDVLKGRAKELIEKVKKLTL
jgi:HEPN domain-containing protein